MSKQQRSTQLPDEIFRLIDAAETRRGTKFNRQMLAALLGYFLADPRGPDPILMRAAVAVENGTLSLNDVPAWIAAQRNARATLQCLDLQSQNPKHPNLRHLRHLVNETDRDQCAWQNIARLGDDTIDGLIHLWMLEDIDYDRERVLSAVALDGLKQMAEWQLQVRDRIRALQASAAANEPHAQEE